MTRFDQVNLAKLDPPTVLRALGFEDELAALLADVTARWPEFTAALESEPVMKLLEAVAYRLLTKVAEFNDAARGLLLATATGSDLDHIAAAMGTARQDGEDDDVLRIRAQLAWEALSTAGPVGAYVYHARSADPRVRDVSVASPVPGTVFVSVLATEGDGTAPDDLIAAVEAAVTAEAVRPLTDTVVVQSADVVPYGIDATLVIAAGPDPDVVVLEASARLQETVAAAHALGGTVSLSALYAALHVEGVISVALASPTGAIVADTHQAPYCTTMSVTGDVIHG